MLVLTLIVGLVILAFALHKSFYGSEIIITILVMLVVFFCILNLYYTNTDSDPHDLYNENTKKIKKKQQLNDAFDAILNKNTSSME